MTEHEVLSKVREVGRARGLLFGAIVLIGSILLGGASAVRADCCGVAPPMGQFTSLGDTLVFVADHGKRGQELWRSDGTPEGTRVVRHILRQKRGSKPRGSLFIAGVARGTAFLWVEDGRQGPELWRSDGTRKGTRLVKDFSSWRKESGTFVDLLRPVGETLYFIAHDPRHGAAVWRSDGTRKGTRMATDVEPDRVAYLTPAGDGFYFTAKDFRQLWHSDGTAEGTTKIATSSKESQFQDLTLVGDTLYFTDWWGRDGQQLWRSDGTAAGTTLVKAVGPSLSTGSAAVVLPVGDRVYVLADYEDPESLTMVRQLWRSDGTPAMTSLAVELRPCWCGARVDLAVLGEALYVRDRGQLWRIDGTGKATLLLAPRLSDAQVAAGVTPPEGAPTRVFDIAVVGDTLYYVADGGRGPNLWHTDGTTRPTSIMGEGPQDPAKTAGALEIIDGTVYWWVFGSGTDTELWRTDGTSAGTRLVNDIPPGKKSPLLADMIAAGGAVFFTHDDGHELWRTDGTPEGTSKLVSFPH